jgi:hypothetical protein
MSGFNFGSFMVDALNIGGGGLAPTAYDYAKVLSSATDVGGVGGLGSLFGMSGHDVPFIDKSSPTNYLTNYITKAYSDNGVIRYLYSQMFNEYAPDISGYVLLFMTPPHLSGYEAKGLQNYKVGNDAGFISKTSKLCPVLAVNFTPPQMQMGSAAITGTTGGQQYATELTVTDSLTVSYLETNNLDVYSFHRTWVNYMFEILEGSLSPMKSPYIDERRIDYASSFYFVKFRPDGEYITYIGKATGCFPRELPSADIVGNRTQNEITTVGFNYVVSDYQEVTFREGNNDSHWLIQELSRLVMSKYDGAMKPNSAQTTSYSPFGYTGSGGGLNLGGLAGQMVGGAISNLGSLVSSAAGGIADLGGQAYDGIANLFSDEAVVDSGDYGGPIESQDNYESDYGSNENYDTDGSSSLG